LFSDDPEIRIDLDLNFLKSEKSEKRTSKISSDFRIIRKKNNKSFLNSGFSETTQRLLLLNLFQDSEAATHNKFTV
jgi:hypothetical protein